MLGALAVLGAVLVGCTSGGGSDGAPGGPSGSAPGSTGSTPTGAEPALTEAVARQVFEKYVRENAAADAKGDLAATARIEGGRLLEESRAEARLRAAKGEKDEAVRYVKPVFLIPGAGTGAGAGTAGSAPQSFAVLSKRQGQESDRSSVLHYFVREGDGGGWRAVVATWVVTEPAAGTPSPPEPEASPEKGVIALRPEVLPSPARDASGRTELSPTGVADGAVCGKYGEFLSFTVPGGKPDSPYFVKGEFTGKLVGFLNGWHEKQLVRDFTYRPVGQALPVFRLKNGGSLVTCTLEGTFHDRGRTPADWISTNAGSDTEVLLGRAGRKWSTIEEVWSVTAVVELPKGGGPATVLSSNAYKPTKMSVKGVEWK
ncbi:hypothetical protein ASE09_17750 [Streptomyces sp. Root66D1]|nr:hypothetical protein ASD33_15160 [Streptomyces sp. Root1304]KRA79983.1 hypothetical protein ASE09_17750 [Streptomyces sp. Root66D1]